MKTLMPQEKHPQRHGRLRATHFLLKRTSGPPIGAALSLWTRAPGCWRSGACGGLEPLHQAQVLLGLEAQLGTRPGAWGQWAAPFSPSLPLPLSLPPPTPPQPHQQADPAWALRLLTRSFIHSLIQEASKLTPDPRRGPGARERRGKRTEKAIIRASL